MVEMGFTSLGVIHSEESPPEIWQCPMRYPASRGHSLSSTRTRSNSGDWLFIAAHPVCARFPTVRQADVNHILVVQYSKS